MMDFDKKIIAIRLAIREALETVGLDVIRNSEFFGTNQERDNS